MPRTGDLAVHLRRWDRRRQRGYALPMAIGLGMATLLLGAMTIKLSQNDLQTAAQRQGQGLSFLVTEGEVARILADFIEPQNIQLLTLDYDPLDVLGSDGIPDSGDEGQRPVDQWRQYKPEDYCVQGGPVQAVLNASTHADSAQIKAYRYNDQDKTGTLLIQGTGDHAASSLLITLDVGEQRSPHTLPGVIAFQSVTLNQHRISGRNGNLYFQPRQNQSKGRATRTDQDRANFLAEIGSKKIDPVEGTLVACTVRPTLSFSIPPKTTRIRIPSFKANHSPHHEDRDRQRGFVETLERQPNSTVFQGELGQITHYQLDAMALKDQSLLFDTTDGPIYLYLNGELSLTGTAKIQNIRRDGYPPRPGDLRIFAGDNKTIQLTDATCLQSVFLYAPLMTLNLKGSQGGCPNQNALVEGVVWVKAIQGHPSGTSGIYVSHDLDSLQDVLGRINVPSNHMIRGVKHWVRSDS